MPVVDYENEKLMISLQNGNENAFPVLVSKNLNSVYNYVLFLLKDKDSAEDVVQETFIKLWKNFRKFNKDQNFKSWLFAIARNTAIDLLRKRKDLTFSQFENEDGQNYLENFLQNDEMSIEDAIDKKYEDDVLRLAISSLPAFYQEVIFFRYNDDFTFEEIAKITGQSLNTVKSRYRRALNNLKIILHQKGV
jgi:RNA polymerase sigma-70 factor (ECF subfamily)